MNEPAALVAHSLFGGVLQSEFPFPELPAIHSDRADWRVRIGSRAPSNVTQILGVERVDEQIRVGSARLADGFRLEFDDTGIFDITAGGSAITWYPAPSARHDLARSDLLGGVFSVALHLQGVLCLHGSGVSIDNQAVGFLAPKGSGKSTLALALTAAGAKLMTDDMLAVDPGPPAMVWPASPAVHLLEDSAEQLERLDAGARNPLRGKYRVANLPAESVAKNRCRLAALYELSPGDPQAEVPAAIRTRITETAAVVTLLRHPKIGESLGRVERLATLDRAARVVREVPIYKLEFAHEFSRLPEVVKQMMTWHRGEPTPPDSA